MHCLQASRQDCLAAWFPKESGVVEYVVSWHELSVPSNETPQAAMQSETMSSQKFPKGSYVIHELP